MQIISGSGRRCAALLVVLATLLGPTHARAQAALVVEPFGGYLRWSGEFDRSVEGLIGGRFALEPSRHFSLGLHYARGFDPDERNLTALQMYGAEITAGVRPLGAFTTSLLLGVAGTSNIHGADAGEVLDPAPELRGVVVGGALHVPLLRRFSLELALRDLLTTAEGEWPWTAGDFGDIRHNLALTGGLGVRVGRRPRPPGELLVPPPAAPAPAAGERVLSPAPGAVRDAVSDTFVRIPVPREGEIYVRYGPAESRLAPRADARGEETEASLIRQLIREEMGLTGTAAPRDQLSEVQLREMEARVVRALDEILTRRIREEMDLLRRQLRADIRELPLQQPLVLPSGAALQLAEPRQRMELTFFGGGSLPAPLQLLAGVRADVAAASPRVRWLRVAPELSIGAGDGGATLMATTNLVAHLPVVGLGTTVVQPHTALGMGVLGSIGDVTGAARAEGVLNFGWGATLRPAPGSRLRLPPNARLFLEHQGVDLFRTHRLLIGMRATR